MNELQLAANSLVGVIRSGKAQIVALLKGATATTQEEVSAVRSALIVARADLAVAQSLALAAVTSSADRASKLAAAAQERARAVGAAIARVPGAVLDLARSELKAQIDSIEQAAERTIRVAQDFGSQVASDATTYLLINGVVAVAVLYFGWPVIKYFLGAKS